MPVGVGVLVAGGVPVAVSVGDDVAVLVAVAVGTVSATLKVYSVSCPKLALAGRTRMKKVPLDGACQFSIREANPPPESSSLANRVLPSVS